MSAPTLDREPVTPPTVTFRPDSQARVVSGPRSTGDEPEKTNVMPIAATAATVDAGMI